MSLSLTRKVRIRAASTPPNSRANSAASVTAFHVGHLLFVLESFDWRLKTLIPVVYECLSPADQRKGAEDLGLDLKGDVEVLRIQSANI